MADPVPRELASLLAASDDGSEEEAWANFVDRYSRLILHAVRSIEGDYDVAMDRYSFVLERLRENDCQRLRSYGGGKRAFSTWLTVVARRLAIDHHRHVYGRVRDSANPVRAEIERDQRKALAELISETDDFSRLPTGGEDPVTDLRRAELAQALQGVIAELDDADRLLLVLRFDDERTGREIARIMHLGSAFHVYRRVNHVLGRLREALEDRGFDGPRP